jgi:hypothetical protein
MAARKRSLPRISTVLGVAGVAAAGLLSTACASTAATASAAATGVNVTAARAHVPAWRDLVTVKNVNKNDFSSAFTTVVATGRTSGWAFLSAGPDAYQRTGATPWQKVPLPDKNGNVTAAAASSPSSVWASYVTGHGSQLDHWTGTQWKAVKTFPGRVSALSVLGNDDVWAFGGLNEANGQGVWHYNGHTWTLQSRTVQGASAVSDKNVWAFAGQRISHYDGQKWTTVDVAKLLPPKPPYGSRATSSVTSVTALSATDVYALGVGVDQPMGGPLVVLHYNGHSWGKVASGNFTAGGGELAADGKGGVWIAAAGTDGNPDLLHYSAGKLIQAEAALPTAPHEYTQVRWISNIPGTAEELAGGNESVPGSSTSASVILEYS